MNIGRLLNGVHRASQHVLQRISSAPSSQASQGPMSASGSLVRTLMTGRFQSLLRPAAVRTQNSAILDKSGPSIATPVGCPSQPVRTKIQYSLTTGGPRTVKAVTDRFFRLHNGQWVRPRAGRNKHRWRKSSARLHRLQEHVMCNKTQSRLLDRMVGRRFKIPRHYPNDPYAPYHKWNNLPLFKALKDKPQFLP